MIPWVSRVFWTSACLLMLWAVVRVAFFGVEGSLIPGVAIAIALCWLLIVGGERT